MAAWLAWRETGEITRVIAARRTAVWMGITGMGGSLCWFTAFTLQNAAYVFAVGQIEVIFSLAASVLFFREKIVGREMLGIGLLSASILGLGAAGVRRRRRLRARSRRSDLIRSGAFEIHAGFVLQCLAGLHVCFGGFGAGGLFFGTALLAV